MTVFSTMMTESKIAAIGRHRFGSDGKGVRTLVAFQGCPLRCKYCINAFTWNGMREGKPYTPEKLLEEVSVDSVYFRVTGGGITFGGGEPLLWSEFISEFIRIAPDFWNFAVETSLSVPFQNIEKVADRVERFVVDIKSMDDAVYRAYTGGELSLAKENLIKLIDLVGAEKVTVRVPFIPEYADRESQKQTAEELHRLGVRHIEEFDYRVK